MITEKIGCNQSTVSRVIKLRRVKLAMFKGASDQAESGQSQKMTINILISRLSVIVMQVLQVLEKMRCTNCPYEMQPYPSPNEKTFTYKENEVEETLLGKTIYFMDTQTHWDSVIFSDDSKFNLHGLNGKWYACRYESEAHHSGCVLPSVKFPVSQIVCGCISSKRSWTPEIYHWSCECISLHTFLGGAFKSSQSGFF